MKKLLLVSFLFAGALLSGCATTNTPIVEEVVSASPIVFEETGFDFGTIKQSGGIVSHDFAFTYTGDIPLKITGTPGSCLCTTGSVNIETLEKGSKGVLTVEFNPNLHAEPEGQFFKTVAVLTDPPLPITPEVKVWTEIDLDLGEEAFEITTSQSEEHGMPMESHNKSSSPHRDDAHENGHDDGALPYYSEVGHDGVVPARDNRLQKKFVLEAHEMIAPLDDGLSYEYWTFGGTVPGPFLHVREGDEVTIELINHKGHGNVHSIDLHAVNGPGGGGDATQVYPGETKSFTFTAMNPGIYVYHCATSNILEHVANGMYGMILVEPKEGFKEVDKEFYVMQGEFFPILGRGNKGETKFSGEKVNEEDPEYVVFNGRNQSLTGDRALKARVGDQIRIYVGNAGISKSSNFHVIGEIFDTVYPEGGTPVQHNIQTTLIPAGGATIVEFTVDLPGTYKLVDHALSRVPKGAFADLIVSAGE